MIILKYSAKQSVDVNRGLAKNWKREFFQDDVRVPDGWVHSLELNGRMVRFAFVRITGAKIPDGNYVIVVYCGTLADAKGGTWSETSFVLPVMAALKPQREDDGKPLPPVLDYLMENALATWTKEQMEQWRKEKKVR